MFAPWIGTVTFSIVLLSLWNNFCKFVHFVGIGVCQQTGRPSKNVCRTICRQGQANHWRCQRTIAVWPLLQEVSTRTTGAVLVIWCSHATSSRYLNDKTQRKFVQWINLRSWQFETYLCPKRVWPVVFLVNTSTSLDGCTLGLYDTPCSRKWSRMHALCVPVFDQTFCHLQNFYSEKKCFVSRFTQKRADFPSERFMSEWLSSCCGVFHHRMQTVHHFWTKEPGKRNRYR